MRIRIYETDFEGRPVDCTGEFYRGENALDIIDGMKMNPFTSGMPPHAFMEQILDAVGQKDFVLPSDPLEAANTFLQRLTSLGYAKFELEDSELDTSTPEASGEKS